MGVAPWELAERSIAWRDWALECERAESDAQEQLRRKDSDRRKLDAFKQGGGPRQRRKR